MKFARGINTEGVTENKARIKYFAALSLLRGVMSSPAAGYEMLQKRKQRLIEQEAISAEEVKDNPIVERWDDPSDSEQIEIIDRAGLSETEWATLHRLAQKAESLTNIEKDQKVNLCVKQIQIWIKNGQSPIVFCRFIATAKYVARILKENLPKDVDVRDITSELSDEERREKIDEMAKGDKKKVMVATDCLSEGINLQDKFNAILHYDLPWNPNRLEQRAGRVDRYGQPGWLDRAGNNQNTIDVKVLFGEDNPMDVVVLKIIIEKINRIQNTSGVSIALADDNRSVMDKVLKEVLLNPEKAQKRFTKQLKLDFGGTPLDELDVEITKEIESAFGKAEKIQAIFAHESIKLDEVKKDLQEVDEAIGNVKTLEDFVLASAKLLGATFEVVKGGYIFRKNNMEEWLATALGSKIHISFQSPTPLNYRYIGRNHRFVELLCHRIIANSLDKNKKNQKAARAAVFRTNAVNTQTTLIQFRVRNVIQEVSKKHEMVSEEMFLWGYEQTADSIKPLEMERCKILLNATDALDISKERQEIIFEKELQHFKELDPAFIKVVESRSNELVSAHTRFAK